MSEDGVVLITHGAEQWRIALQPSISALSVAMMGRPGSYTRLMRDVYRSTGVDPTERRFAVAASETDR